MAKPRRRAPRTQPSTAPAPVAALQGFDPLVEGPLLLCLFLGPWLAAFDTEVAGRWLDAGLGLCWALGGGLILAGKRRMAAPGRSPLLLLYLWAILVAAAMSATMDRGYSVPELTRICAAGAAAFVPLMVRPEHREGAAYRMAIALVAGGLIAATSGLTQWLRNAVTLGAYDWRTFGTFSNPNALAGYLALATPVAVALALLARERALRLLGWFVVAVMACAVPLTQSRAGIGSFLAGLFLFALLAMPGSALRRLKVAGGGLALLILALLSIGPLSVRLVTTFTVNHSLMFRLHCWHAAWAAALERPLLGWGPGTYPIAHSAVAQVGPTLHAHQDALHVAVESGLPAAALLIGALVWAAARAARASLRIVSRRGRLLLIAAACGTVAVLAHGLLESDLRVRPTLIALMALVGGAELLGGRVPEPRSPRWFGFLLLLLGLGVVTTAGSVAVSGAAMRRGEESESMGLVAAAARQYDRAFAWFQPDATPLRRKLALHPESIPDLEAGFVPVLAANPHRAVSHEALADCLVRVGEIQRAEPHYRRATELAPTRVMSILGLTTAAEERGDTGAVWDYVRALAELEASPYGLYRAVPEMLTLEFVIPKASAAEMEGPRGIHHFVAGVEAVDAYLETHDRLEAQFSKQYDGDRTLVALNLQMRGLRPRTVAQARMMRARLRWLQAEAAEEPTEKQNLRNEAIQADAAAVSKMDRGAWRGILVETAALRAEGGL